MRRVIEVYAVYEAAGASEALSDPVCSAVRGEGTHVTLAVWQLDVGQQDRVAAVGNVINGKVRPIVFGGHEEVAPLIGLHSLVRIARRGSVVQVRAHPRMLGGGGIDHPDAEGLLQRR